MSHSLALVIAAAAVAATTMIAPADPDDAPPFALTGAATLEDGSTLVLQVEGEATTHGTLAVYQPAGEEQVMVATITCTRSRASRSAVPSGGDPFLVFAAGRTVEGDSLGVLVWDRGPGDDDVAVIRDAEAASAPAGLISCDIPAVRGTRVASGDFVATSA